MKELKYMKICKRCFNEFPEDEDTYDPATDLVEIFISDIGDVDVNDLCPMCREELGVDNILGFKPLLN